MGHFVFQAHRCVGRPQVRGLGKVRIAINDFDALEERIDTARVLCKVHLADVGARGTRPSSGQ